MTNTLEKIAVKGWNKNFIIRVMLFLYIAMLIDETKNIPWYGIYKHHKSTNDSLLVRGDTITYKYSKTTYAITLECSYEDIVNDDINVRTITVNQVLKILVNTLLIVQPAKFNIWEWIWKRN